MLIILVGVPGPVTVDRGLSHGMLEEGLSRRESGMGFCYQGRKVRLVYLSLGHTEQRDVRLG